MKILWNNFLLDSSTVITPSSQDNNYPISEATHEHLSREWRSLTNTDESILIDLGSAKHITEIVIDSSMNTPDMTLEANTTNDFSSPPYSVTQSNVSFPLFLQLDETYRYWRLTFDAISESFVSINNLFMTTALQLEYIGPAPETQYSTNSQVGISLGGQVFGVKQIIAKEPLFKIPVINRSKKRELESAFYYTDVVRPFWIIPYENHTTSFPPLWCVFKDPLFFTKLPQAGEYYKVDLSLLEVF